MAASLLAFAEVPVYLTVLLVMMVVGLILAVIITFTDWKRREPEPPPVPKPQLVQAPEAPAPAEPAGAGILGSTVLTSVLVVAFALGIFLLVPKLSAFRTPGNQQGYEPVQPIAFSHRLHAGEMQIACLYCHSGAIRSRHAGIPSASTCMNCHKFVTATMGAVRAEDELAKKEKRAPQPVISPEIEKIYDALALDPLTRQPDPGKTPHPIVWDKVTNLPDFVYFDHRPHVARGVACQQCHGPVEAMEQARQELPLNMGFCVNCHRDVDRNGLAGSAAAPVQLAAWAQPNKPVQASIDCSTCHY
jgi:hypothetical protein